MSVDPAMRAEMPVPDPPPVTWTTTSGRVFIYVSAHRWFKITMVSEPLTVMVSPARTAAADRKKKSGNSFFKVRSQTRPNPNRSACRHYDGPMTFM
jgi:hypothetical protein